MTPKDTKPKQECSCSDSESLASMATLMTALAAAVQALAERTPIPPAYVPSAAEPVPEPAPNPVASEDPEPVPSNLSEGATTSSVPAPVLAAPAPVHFVPDSAPVPVGYTTSPEAATDDASPALRWYTVTIGRVPGVHQGWHNVSPLTSGISGACFQRHNTAELAHAAYREAYEKKMVHVRQ